MRAALVIGCLAIGLSACGTSPTSVPPAASASPEPSASAVPESSEPSVSATAESPASASSPSPSASAATRLPGFTVCPKQVDGPACPLPRGEYTAEVHDGFSFSISEDGWWEERQPSAEFGTTMVLEWYYDVSQRLTFLSGPTRPTSPVDLGASFVAPAGFTASQPVDTMISGTEAQYLDLVPAGGETPASLNIDGAIFPIMFSDKSYRLTLAKIPMGQEAATLVIVTEAIHDKFANFVQTADAVIRSVKF